MSFFPIKYIFNGDLDSAQTLKCNVGPVSLIRTLEENYCRNPNSEKSPWCYTSDPGTRWEYCRVPRCGEGQ